MHFLISFHKYFLTDNSFCVISTRRSSSRKSAGQHAAVDAVDSRKPTTAAPANKISTAVPGEDSLQNYTFDSCKSAGQHSSRNYCQL